MIIVPNSSVNICKGRLELESSMNMILDAFINDNILINVAAAINIEEGICLHRSSEYENVHLVSLGKVRKSKNKYSKVISYIIMLPKIIKTVINGDIFYIFAPGHVGLIFSFLCLIFNRPFALYLRGDWTVLTPRLFHWAESIILKNAKFIICTGNELTNKIKKYNSLCEAVVPMTNLIHIDIALKESYSLKNKTRFLFVGEIRREKGVFELIDAMLTLKQNGVNNFILTLVGEGSDKRELVKYVERLGIEDQVRLEGYISDMHQLARIYKDNDIFILPTYYEGFPRVIYEAMIFGLPIITTRVGQIDSLIKNEVNGILIKYKSSKAIVQSIMLLSNDEKMRIKLGQNAQKTIEPLIKIWRKTAHGHQIKKYLAKSGFISEENVEMQKKYFV